MQIATKIQTGQIPNWSEFLRVYANEKYAHDDKIWQNLSGINVEPVEGDDWTEIKSGSSEVKVSAAFIYDGENNVFDIGGPVAQILDVMIGNGANFDDTVVGFAPGDSEIEINSEDLLEGMKIKFLYI